MKHERTFIIIALGLLPLLIAATVICAVMYMHDDLPWWNREPAPAVTDAPDAAQGEPWLEVVTENQPPGRG